MTQQQAELIKREIDRLTGKVYDLTGQAPAQTLELIQAYHELCKIARGALNEKQRFYRPA